MSVEPMAPILPITDTKTLRAFCRRQAKAPYVTVDTEFVREKTYWPVLCLVQVAGPEEAMVIDMLAPELDPRPLYELLADPEVLKVFHAARQDLEIFFHRMKKMPAPIFDTQVAAMVCGFGDQVGYETLVGKLVGAKLDKMSRMADWSRRPLTRKQLEYAIADVVHLRPAYEELERRLKESGRAHWLAEEMAVLTDPETYRLDPENAWERIKTRSGSARFFQVLKAVAAWREHEAQRRDVPRNRVLRDDSLLDIAAHAPSSREDLARSRGVSKGFADGALGAAVLKAIETGLAADRSEMPVSSRRERPGPGVGALTDLLRVLLKHKCEEHNVASRLVASADDLHRIAMEKDADVPALKGWRREVFGADALDLKRGRLALAAGADGIVLIRTKDSSSQSGRSSGGQAGTTAAAD